MQGRAVPLNPPQVGIVEGNESVDSFLGHGANRRNEYFVFSALDGDTEDLHNGGPENGLNNLEDVGHLVPGPLVAVDPADGNGDEEVAPIAQLQQREQEDLEALRNVLGRPIHNNALTKNYLWKALKKLIAILPKEGSYRIPYLQADFARILERLARVITIPSRENYESTHCNHPLGYDDLFPLLQGIAPECPFEYGEFLDKLCENMTAAASMVPGADGVFVMRDREEFASVLRSLAARLLRAP